MLRGRCRRRLMCASSGNCPRLRALPPLPPSAGRATQRSGEGEENACVWAEGELGEIEGQRGPTSANAGSLRVRCHSSRRASASSTVHTQSGSTPACAGNSGDEDLYYPSSRRRLFVWEPPLKGPDFETKRSAL